MPAYHGVQSLNSVMNAVIDELGLRAKLDATRIVETWAMLAGPQINGVTDKAWYRGGKLYVRISSSAWRHELHLRRRAWCQRLNEDLGEMLVDEVVFR